MVKFKYTRFFTLVLLTLLTQQSVAQSYFIENKGQWSDKVEYRAEFDGAWVYLEKDGFTFDTYDQEVFNKWAHAHVNPSEERVDLIPFHAFKMQMHGVSPVLQLDALGKSDDYNNYMLGAREQWAGEAYNYQRIFYRNVYSGIDIRIQRQKGQFKYDWIIEPSAEIDDILFSYEGADKVRIKKGKLIIETSVKNFVEYIPVAYYLNGEPTEKVAINYVKKGNKIGFEAPKGYDRNRTLYIDPVLIFSTYSGSSANNFGYTATFDSKGFLYAGSTAFGSGYPANLGAYTTFQGGTVDVAITKYDTTGTFRVYSTYLGGNNNEMPHSMIVNSNDELFVYGTSGSSNFPTLDNAYQPDNNLGTSVNFGSGLGFAFDQGEDIFITRMSEDGLSLVASTFIGGTGTDGLNMSSQLIHNYADEVRGEILIDANDNIYVVSSTQSNDFPITTNAYQSSLNGTQDGVIFKMDNNLTSLVWSSYFGGSGVDAFYAMDLDSENRPIVCGGTTSGDLPNSISAFQEEYAGNTDGFLVKFDANGTELEACTYLGFEEYDQIYFVEFDNNDAPYIFGQTETGDNYSMNNIYSNLNSGQYIGAFNTDLSSYDWGMCFGNGNGIPNISPTAFLVDYCNQIYLTGWGSGIQGGSLTTTGMPTSVDAFKSTTTGNDFYIYITGTTLAIPVYASFYGGDQSSEHVDGGTSRFDKKGKIYQAVCAGCGGFDDFPIFPSNAVSDENGNSCNIGVFKMDFEEDLVIADFSVETVCFPDPVSFENFSFNAQNYEWDFGDTEISSLSDPTHVYAAPGIYDVTLVVSNPGTCNETDTLVKTIVVLSPDGFALEDITLCPNAGEQIGIPPFGDATITYSWSPSSGLSDPTAPNPFFTGQTNMNYTLSIDNGICISDATQAVEVFILDLQATGDTIICEGDQVLLNVNGQGVASNFQWSDVPDFSNVISNADDIIVSPNTPSVYYVSADYLTCLALDSVIVVPAPFQAQLSDDIFICLNEEIELSAINLYSNFEMTYLWTPTAQIISGNTSEMITAQMTDDTWFYVNMENELGCQWIDSIFVEVSDLDVFSVQATALDNIIVEGQSTTMNGTPGNPYTVTWTPPSGLSNPNNSTTGASPNTTTTYTYTVTDNSPLGSCNATDSVTITVVELNCGFPTVFLPNSFTPNGDDENDVLFLRGSLVKEMELMIYDRWGEKIFESQDQSIGWDGTYKDREADSGVYVYLLKVICLDEQEVELKGNVTLIR